MIKVRIAQQLEKSFNGLVVYLDVLEKSGDICSKCGEDEFTVLNRTFQVAKITRGAITLRLDTHYSREAQSYVREKMGHGLVLCLDCFEKLVDAQLGGFETAD